IFTGLNNLEVVSIENKEYGEYFGFTEEEVEEMLVHYERTSRRDTVREWYNGYVFGVDRVYNPWSLVNYMKTLYVDEHANPSPYWSHSSGNSIVKDLVNQADLMVKNELEILMAGDSIEKAIHEDITYEEMSDSKDNIWNFLYFTGYLTKVDERFENRKKYVKMEIPNEEVAYIYEMQIHQWIQKFLEQKVKANSFLPFYQATIEGDAEGMEEEFNQFLMGTISYYDGSESFYHGLLSGAYNGIEGYYLYSNIEVGKGRPDLILLPPTRKGKAFIIEIKVTKEEEELERKAEEALAQIRTKWYRQGLEGKKYKDITCYGIAFCQKSCVVKKL
ncbi:MAG: PD-(D/E)XK nuclease domain-containing protein, partial [Eubacteriales bacterium]